METKTECTNEITLVSNGVLVQWGTGDVQKPPPSCPTRGPMKLRYLHIISCFPLLSATEGTLKLQHLQPASWSGLRQRL